MSATDQQDIESEGKSKKKKKKKGKNGLKSPSVSQGDKFYGN